MTATYADRIQGVETSLAIKAPVKAATTANVTLSGAQTIDGVSVTTGDRVLVKDQTDATENGIYKVSTGAWTRAVDFDGARDVAQGTEVLIANGTVHANTRYVVSTSDPVIGSTSIAFTPTGGGVSSRVDITPFVADGATNSFEIPGVFIDKKNVFPFSGGIPQYPDQFSLSNDGTNTTVTATENFPEGALVYCYADAQQSVAAANADTITLPNGVSVRDAIALSYNLSLIHI